MLFEIHGLILALHYEARFLKQGGAYARANRGFENILRRYGAGPETTPAAARGAKKPAKSSSKE